MMRNFLLSHTVIFLKKVRTWGIPKKMYTCAVKKGRVH